MSITRSSVPATQQRADRLDVFLDGLAAPGLVLHGRRAPRSQLALDHLVVAPSGIWLIEAQCDEGRVERRDVGDWRTVDERLFVDRRDRSDLIAAMNRRRRVVEHLLAPLGFSDALIRRALVFSRADWGMFTKPFAIDGVEVLWARALSGRLAAAGPLTSSDMTLIAQHLREHLPPKTVCTRSSMASA